MAISVTEILATDSISGSRIVLNDNFNVLATEINAMEVYFSPSAGTILNLSQLTTNTLTVGTSSAKLTVGASTISIDAATSCSENFTFNGRILRANQASTSVTTTTSLGSTSSYPTNDLYRVSNSGSGSYTITLFEGIKGQTITFVYETSDTGAVDFAAGTNTSLIGVSTLTLDGEGQTVTLMAVTDSAGTGQDWYVVGGQGYTLT